MYGTRNIDSFEIDCVCATNPNCHSATAIYNLRNDDFLEGTFSVEYLVPGSYAACSTIESLRLSTLECLYSSSPCFAILLKYIRAMYTFNVEYPSSFDPRPLVHDGASERFLPNGSLAILISQVMVEHWNSSSSHKQFYRECAPSYCTYVEKIHTKTFFAVIITLIYSIGGVSVSWRLLTPHLIKLVLHFFTKSERKPRRPLKEIIKNLFVLLYTIIVNLSIFPLRHFGEHINRTTAKQLSRWATRLYVLLLIVSVAILALYTIIRPQTLTKTFDRPSLDVYTRLHQQYGSALKCSCATVASVHRQLVSIETTFHEVTNCEHTLT